VSQKAPRVVVGVTGSIAAYKACELVRRLKERGAETKCVLTRSAQQFVAPLALQVLSGEPVLSDLHDPTQWQSAHLALADWAEAVVIAPATADCIARLASGRAEDLLDALVLSTRAPVALCPAMETHMWEHPATRANVEKLSSYGYKLWGPAEGALASGKSGVGRMIEPDEIAARVFELAAPAGRRGRS
jgi:phosphopantothenoylcysteine decarboxylase/phosphopantothenate--cysteine ligase